MAIFYFPELTAENYDFFRDLLHDDMPKTFAQWDQRQMNEKDKHALEWGAESACIDIEVNPEEFDGYCKVTNSNYTLQTLNRLAAEKGLRESQ